MLRRSELLREEYESIRHPSGLSIYVFPKKLTTTYAIFSTAYGSLDTVFRPEGQEEWIETPAGVAHFLEHKLFDDPDGSDSFEKFSAYGADANAYTTCNRTAYLFSCTDRFEESLTELLRFVTTPYFTPATVKKEQGIIAEEIRMYNDSPWERCLQDLMEAMYEKNPIRVNICGSEESISHITDEILYQCYRAFYQLSNMALIVCGDVTPERVLAVADAVLPREGKVFPVERRSVQEPCGVFRHEIRTQMQVSKPIFSIGIKDPDIPADPEVRLRRDALMSVLDEILFSRSGEFYSGLFEDGIVTSAWSYGYSVTDRFACHTISGEGDHPETVVKRMRAHMEEVARHGIAREDFERCRRVLYADEIRSYDSTDEIANNLLTFVFDGVDLFHYPELLLDIRCEELQPLLERMLREDAWSLSVVEPLEPPEETPKENLKKGEPSGR